MCLDLRLIALKIYWSKGQGCVRITAEGIKSVGGDEDASSTGTFQLKVDAADVSGTTTNPTPGFWEMMFRATIWILCRYCSKRSEDALRCAGILFELVRAVSHATTPQRVSPMSRFLKRQQIIWLLPMSNLQWISGKDTKRYEKIYNRSYNRH